MPRSKTALLLLMTLIAGTAMAQVVSPSEIKDTELRSLQQQYLQDLTQAGHDILANHFDYPFYLSRRLDLDETQQQRTDQRSIRFERFNGQTVLAVSGNYYAAYSGEKMDEEQRARNSFQNVVLPILKALVSHFQANHTIQGYAVEISHHVIMKVMGVPVERPENLMVFLPRNSAIKLVEAHDSSGLQAALLDAQVYLNAAPLSLWLDEQTPPRVTMATQLPAHRTSGEQSALARAETQLAEDVMQVSQSAASPPATAGSMTSGGTSDPGAPHRDTSPKNLVALQRSYEELIAGMVKQLEPQAHFVSYAPPAFITFRRGIYLELSVTTTLKDTKGRSQYKLAALAFDEHIAHLIRPSFSFVKDAQGFDGIAFSSSVHLSEKGDAGSVSTEAVEFFFPLQVMHCYVDYECTGQQVINAGTVLINGERVGLDLQKAETDDP
jgi:hypothetical protein